MTHFHVASGLCSYGPDGADGYHAAGTWLYVADMIRYELNDFITMLHDEADALGERQDFEGYYKARELADSLEVVRATLDNDRATAPLYAGDEHKWAAEIARIVTEKFPLAVSTNGAQRLYAWQCDTPDRECEHND